MKRLCTASLINILLIICMLFMMHHPVPKSECWICSGKLQSYISYESAFGIIDLTSRSVSTIPNGDWGENSSVTITSSGDGIMIITSPVTANSYRADIFLMDGSRPDGSIMSEYLCADCIEKFSVNKYGLLLMDAATGTLSPISDNMKFTLPPYTITASQENTESIRLIFEKK